MIYFLPPNAMDEFAEAIQAVQRVLDSAPSVNDEMECLYELDAVR